MTHEEFEHQLQALIGKPTDVRPFVCDGSPLRCQIFLVGINPATMMEADFWDFWSTSAGFDKNRWFRQYLSERAAKPLKPGKTRRQEVSATRRNIEEFIEGAAGEKVLETNIFSAPSEDFKSLELSRREVAPFRFLLSAIKPKVIFVHGKPALEEIQHFEHSATVIKADHHFARRTSKKKAREYGASAANLC